MLANRVIRKIGNSVERLYEDLKQKYPDIDTQSHDQSMRINTSKVTMVPVAVKRRKKSVGLKKMTIKRSDLVFPNLFDQSSASPFSPESLNLSLIVPNKTSFLNKLENLMGPQTNGTSDSSVS